MLWFAVVAQAVGEEELVGRACLKAESFYPFGIDTELTLSDDEHCRGIAGLLHIKVSLPGRGRPTPLMPSTQSNAPLPPQAPWAAQPLAKVVSSAAVSGAPTALASAAASQQATPVSSYAPPMQRIGTMAPSFGTLASLTRPEGPLVSTAATAEGPALRPTPGLARPANATFQAATVASSSKFQTEQLISQGLVVRGPPSSAHGLRILR